MATARLDYKVSVTPIEQTTDGAAGGPVQVDAISFNFQKSLGGGNSSVAWTGSDSAEWVAGVNTMITANGGTITTPASCNGVWIKNSGVTFADQTVKANADSKVEVIVNTKVICILGIGEGIFFPSPAQETNMFTLDDVGTDDVAVEYAIFK